MSIYEGGDPVEPRCPKCGDSCVYNGNYFCTECDWALPIHERVTPIEERIWFLEAIISLYAYRVTRGRELTNFQPLETYESELRELKHQREWAEEVLSPGAL